MKSMQSQNQSQKPIQIGNGSKATNEQNKKSEQSQDSHKKPVKTEKSQKTENDKYYKCEHCQNEHKKPQNNVMATTTVNDHTPSTTDAWPSSSVLTLPDPILLKIFSHLSEEQVCMAARVCHEWKRVAYDSSLWQSVDLRRFHPALDEIRLTHLVRTRMIPLLYKINLGGLSLTPRVFQIFATNCPKLKILSLESVTFLENFNASENSFPSGLLTLDLRHSSGDASAFRTIGLNVRGVESLGISDQYLTTLLFSLELEAMFPRLANIRVLEFSYCVTLTDAMLGYVATYCRFLESLCLRRCNTIHGSSLPLLIDSCTNLQSLVLDGTSITDSSLKVVDWSNCLLTELDLSWCRHLSADGLKSVLSRLPLLRYLRLCCVGYGHGLTDEVLDEMATIKYEHLQILDASYSSAVTDQGLGRFLDVCRGLLYLRINHCRSTTPKLVELIPSNCEVFVVANFPIDNDIVFNRELLRYTYWPTPVYMRNYSLDLEMGWK